jgi:hypothetical protein
MAHQVTAVALLGVATMLAWQARRY